MIDGTIKIMTIDEIENNIVGEYNSRDKYTGFTDKSGNEIFENDRVFRGNLDMLEQFNDTVKQDFLDRETYVIKQEDGTFMLDNIGHLPLGQTWSVKFVASAYKHELELL